MAFIDLGDQFIALMQADADGPHVDRTRHHGIVVDDKEALRAELLDAGVEVARSGSLRIHDPSGNQLEIVDYRDVQFSKTGAVLARWASMACSKSESARRELADKGMLELSGGIPAAGTPGTSALPSRDVPDPAFRFVCLPLALIGAAGTTGRGDARRGRDRAAGRRRWAERDRSGRP